MSDETVAMPSEGGRPPPGQTQPMYVTGPPGPPRGRQALIFGLIFLLGMGGGFVLAQFFGGEDSGIPDENLVLYENASVGFPVAGAAFTQSTYDATKRECDREALKRFLRADPRRFKAWLELQGISESEFDAFVDRLVTRFITVPTHYTNHGCHKEGEGACPFEVNSVLAPGTPVWYDPVQQRVVAKCTCSNPLKEPKCPPNCDEGPSPSPSPSTAPPTTAPPETRPPETEPPRTTAPPTTQPPTESPCPPGTTGITCQPTPTPTEEPIR